MTETWIQPNVSSSELVDGRYSVFRADRDLVNTGVSRGGGVLLAVKNKYNAVQLNLQTIRMNIARVDIVGCKVGVSHKQVFVIVIYVPPDTSASEFVSLFEEIESLGYLYGKKVFILGDFNIPNLHDSILSDQKLESLFNFSTLFDLKQYNDIHNANNRTLDLVLSNIQCEVSKELLPLVPEDTHHPVLNISLLLDVAKVRQFPVGTSHTRYNFRRADFPQLYSGLLNADWSDTYGARNVDEACKFFYETIASVFGLYVPTSVVHKRNFPVWFTTDIIKLIKRKHRIFRKLKISDTELQRNQYHDLRLDIKRRINLAYKNYLSKVENSMQGDPSSFWAFVNSKRCSSPFPSLFVEEGIDYSDPTEIANLFANFFSSVYKNPAQGNVLQHFQNDNLNISSHVTLNCVSEEAIRKFLKKSKNKMSMGPDNIPSFIVRDCASAFSKPLSFIYNLALTTHSFPRVWKEARITPLFKKGNVNNISNYRPISMLSPFAKAFERLIHENVFNQVKYCISESQHGFYKSRSTTTNLASFTHFVGQTLDARGQVDAVYMDFSKAFDRVDHSIFLLKLQWFGFDDNLIRLFASYLSDRYQYVDIRGYHSFRFQAASGAPQGSILAPLIFSLFINDIGINISSNILLFADDLKIFRQIHCVSDCIALQDDIRTVSNWCTVNNLPLNTEKCYKMTYTNKKTLTQFDYYINREILQDLKSFRDLGVVFDERLWFSDHINQVYKSAMQMLGFIFRNSYDFSNIDTIKSLYFAYVRSKLEYAAIVWHPIHSRYTCQLEGVQRKFLKFLVYKTEGIFPPRGSPQETLLLRFQISSLADRRNFMLVLFLFKICNSAIDCPYLLSKLSFNVPPRALRHYPVFNLPFHATNFQLKSPLFQAMKIFNAKCNDIDITSLTYSQFLKVARDRCLGNIIN